MKKRMIKRMQMLHEDCSGLAAYEMILVVFLVMVVLTVAVTIIAYMSLYSQVATMTDNVKKEVEMAGSTSGAYVNTLRAKYIAQLTDTGGSDGLASITFTKGSSTGSPFVITKGETSSEYPAPAGMSSDKIQYMQHFTVTTECYYRVNVVNRLFHLSDSNGFLIKIRSTRDGIGQVYWKG